MVWRTYNTAKKLIPPSFIEYSHHRYNSVKSQIDHFLGHKFGTILEITFYIKLKQPIVCSDYVISQNIQRNNILKFIGNGA